jgi:competence protein ComEC
MRRSTLLPILILLFIVLISGCISETGKVTEKPVEQQKCIENWQCGDWSPCTSDYIQTRTCTDTNRCNTREFKPAEAQGCVYTPPCTENWQCDNWSACTQSGIQSRACVDKNNCGTTNNRPASSQGCVYIPQTPPEKQSYGNVTVHFIYVDIGDAIFIDTNGKDVLLDGGCSSCSQEVISYLGKINASKIDLIIASHHDEDHIGGLIPFLNNQYRLDVWDSGSTKDTQVYQNYITFAQQKNLIFVKRGQIYWLDNNTKITILNPAQYLEFDKENDNSVVFKMEVGNVSFLFMGDCEYDCENSILMSGLNVSAVILKAGHHCSSTSTSDTFLYTVNPKVAICSVGVTGNYKYGHPAPITISKLQANSVETYVTLSSGNIKITTDGKTFSVQTQQK